MQRTSQQIKERMQKQGQLPCQTAVPLLNLNNLMNAPARGTPRVADMVDRIERLESARSQKAEQFSACMAPRVADILDSVEMVESARSQKSEQLSEESSTSHSAFGPGSSRPSSCRNGRFGSQAPRLSQYFSIGTPRPRLRTSSMSDGQAHESDDGQALSPLESDDESDDEEQASLVSLVAQRRSVEMAHEEPGGHESDDVDYELNPVLETLDHEKREHDQRLEESEATRTSEKSTAEQAAHFPISIDTKHSNIHGVAGELCESQSSSSSSQLTTSRTESELNDIDSCEVLRKTQVLAEEMKQSNDDTASVVAQESVRAAVDELRLQVMALQKENTELKKQQEREGSAAKEITATERKEAKTKEAKTKDKAEENAFNNFSERLIVQARVVKAWPLRRIVFYDVYRGRRRKSGILKSIRYSELSRFHEDVMREVPEFKGQLPCKSFLRHTSTDFVESRRVDIQAYLRAIAMDSRVSRSKVFQNFFQAQKQHDALYNTM